MVLILYDDGKVLLSTLFGSFLTTTKNMTLPINRNFVVLILRKITIPIYHSSIKIELEDGTYKLFNT